MAISFRPAVLFFAAIFAFAAEGAPQEKMAPVRIAVMAFANPEDNTRIVRAVRKALGPLLKTRGIDLKFCTFEEFEREAVSKKTDLVLGTSGHIRRLAHHNIQPIATIVAHPGADPNRAEGTAVVVRSDRFELQTLGDLRTRIVAANNPLGFTGWQIVLGEIAKFGVEEPRSFFGKVIFTGDSRSTDRIAELVIDGEADAGFLRLCAYEAFLKRHPEKIGLLRVLDRRESSLACAHSTDLFPGFTLAVTEHIAPELARRLALALFSMEPDEGGPKWAVPANFLTVDRLLQTLEVGPWEGLGQGSIMKLVERNLPWVLLTLALILGLIFHSWRSEVVARRRGEKVRELMEKEMKQAEALQTMHYESTMVQLANLFAHELRQPLACASLYAEGLARQFRRGKFDPEKMAGICDKVSDETHRASEIVERVRAYAKGRGEERKHLSVEKLMQHCVHLWRTYSALDIPLVFSAPDPDAALEGNEFELEVALVNLLKNAREAVQGSKAPAVSFTGAVENDRVVIRVMDSGTPPTDEELSRLGIPASSEKAHGLGLGLSIASGLIENHGGSIAFSRGPGGIFTGLAVTVTFPLLPGESVEK